MGLLLLAMTPSVYASPVKPVELNSAKTVLDITDDIPTAEAQAKANPANPEAQFLLAIAYSRSPYVEKALAVLQRTKQLIKDRADRLQTMDRLIGEYEAALRQRPNDTRLLYRLAFGYYLNGQGIRRYKQQQSDSQALSEQWIHRAEDTMRRVIQLDNEDIWARDYLGFVLAEEGHDQHKAELTEQAIALWKESIKVSAANPPAYWFLAEAALKQGNLLKAAEYAEKGVQARAGLLSP